MKKFIVILLVLAICCGVGVYAITSRAQDAALEEIGLPTVPQIEVPTLPAREDSEETAVESTEAAEPTGQTHPWETEFNGEGYNLVKASICDIEDYTKTVGEVYQWFKGGIGSPCARELKVYDNGDIQDTYYYPEPNLTESHSYKWGADGSYAEFRYLDGGYQEISSDGSVIYHLGTTVYYKIINTDGSWEEYRRSDDDSNLWEILQNSDGYYSEEHYFEDGTSRKLILNKPEEGTYQEVIYYENRQLMRSVFENSQTGEYFENEFFENGNAKYNKSQTPELTMEERFDPDGYRTYYYCKLAGTETECIADESGKLIKVVENGEVMEDAAILTRYASDYNFRQ